MIHSAPSLPALAPLPPPAAMAAAIERRQAPLVDDRSVTFVFRGQADRVYLRHWVYGLPSAIDMLRLEGTDLWYHRLQFPDGSRIEYKFGVVAGGHERWIHDPGNPRIAMDPFGGNSVVHCPGYATPEWTQEASGVARGRFDEFPLLSRVWRRRRPVRVYLPPGFKKSRRYRLLVVHDGSDYFRYAQLGVVLDNLLARWEIPPLVVAFSDPGERLVEYADSPQHAAHVVEELVPALLRRYPLIAEPAGRCLMGASFGAVAALSTAWRFPGYFDALLLQSGSFAFTDIGQHSRSPVFDRVVEFTNTFRQRPGVPARRVFLSCGTYESLIYENRSMVPFLQRCGIDVNYAEARDGHNWENWRDRLRDGLGWLFPGPLWVTYW